jgi:membrane-associated protein
MIDPVSLWDQACEIVRHLFNSQELMATLSQPGYVIAAFLVLNLIVFTETGLLVGFFLPGDSLLVTAGIVCYNSNWNLALLLGTLCAAAVLGDSVGYLIGYRTGPKIFRREKSLVFHKDHLLKAQEFYERHGGKTIILARFIPILRTFAPVVAGVGRMEYRSFLFFNVCGGVGWVVSMIGIGYLLTPFLDPLLRPVFGEHFKVQDHIEKVILVVVFLSVSPGLYAWFRSKWSGGPETPVVQPVPLEAVESKP